MKHFTGWVHPSTERVRGLPRGAQLLENERMHCYWSCVLMFVCGSPLLTAGQIYGTLRDATGKGMPGIEIVIVSPAKTSYEGRTAADGSYQIFVKETGRCEFRVNAGGKTPATANVFSYADPAKYEFEVSAGNLTVK
jgi:hypothetical protein